MSPSVHALAAIQLVGDDEQIITCCCRWSLETTRDMDAVRIIDAHALLANVTDYMGRRRVRAGDTGG